jgi:hypothetical protein
MTIAERIFVEVRALPEDQARAVLKYVRFLQSRRAVRSSAQQDMSAFDQFGAVYEGPLNRGERHEPAANLGEGVPFHPSEG